MNWGECRVMYKHNWTKAFILAGLLALPSTASMAAVVEMIIIPCTPQLRPDECGVKVSVTGGTATFTTAAGEVIDRITGHGRDCLGNRDCLAVGPIRDDFEFRERRRRQPNSHG